MTDTSDLDRAREIAGEDFCKRAEAAAKNIPPLTPEAAAALASGPEVSGDPGGLDPEPEDTAHSSSDDGLACDVCGEPDSDERIYGKVEVCRSCLASAEYRIEQLTAILARWMGEYASPALATSAGRTKREHELWAACENAGIKPEPRTAKATATKGGSQ